MNAAFTGLRKRDGEAAAQNAENNDQETRADSIHGEEKCVPISQPEKATGVQLQPKNIYPWCLSSSFSRLPTPLVDRTN